MKKYWVAFKIEWQRLFAYRGDLIIYTFSGFILPLVGLGVWLSVLRSGADIPLNYFDLVIYFLFTMWVYMMTISWAAYFLSESINKGIFGKYLVKPYSLFADYVVNNIAEKTYKVPFFSLLLFVFGFFLLKDTNGEWSINIYFIALFCLSLVFATIINILIDLIIGLTTFWFHEIDFLYNLSTLTRNLFSGRLIPLIFLPGFLYQVSIYLPFRYTLSFPVEIILNKLTTEQLILGFAIQLVWLLSLFLIYKILFWRGVNLYQSYGS